MENEIMNPVEETTEVFEDIEEMDEDSNCASAGVIGLAIVGLVGLGYGAYHLIKKVREKVRAKKAHLDDEIEVPEIGDGIDDVE